ncbi:zinc finger protein 107-like [Stegodyphus dumicola]|uniref:zinc finger protein 107-like n=1 Tax=Stegodyphus dumicola TaxID=202533 RepID=UPI0015AE6770|nr:zinc finger protein 107-like [Stegodyphus dumicola]
MEFTKKYVLVPEEMMTKHTISDKQLSELDKAMMHILNSSDDDREKLVRYYELLQKKLNLKEYNSPFKPPKDDSQNSLDDSAEMKKVKEEEEEAPSSVTDGDKQMTVTDYSTVILDSVPLRMRRKAQNALAILKRHPDILKWNDKGEFIDFGIQEEEFNSLTSERMEPQPSTREVCDICGKSFSKKSNLVRHSKTHEGKIFHCEECQAQFTRADSLRRHIQNIHVKKNTFSCEKCNDVFSRKHDLMKHNRTQHGTVQSIKRKSNNPHPLNKRMKRRP